MKKQQFKKKAKEARKPSKLAKVKKTCTSKINLDIQEKLARDFKKHAFSGAGLTLGALGMEIPDIVEAPPDQDAPGALKTEIPEENMDAAKDTGQAGSDTPQAQEAEKNFETQRESIEDLDTDQIQPFRAIPDYVELTSSLYPIVVKTPTAITCIEGWSLVEQAKEAGKSSLTCHVHHVADASQEELAIRKVASRTKPLGGIAGYAEKARNVSKAFLMVKESNENPIVFAHGGARRGIVFASTRDENIRIVLGKRLEKSQATIGKYINHGDYIGDEEMQILGQGDADKEFFEAFQEVKMKLVEHLKGQRVSQDEIVSRVSEEILRVHQVPKKTRSQEIKNLLASLAPDQPLQNTSAVEPVESEPVPTTAHAEEREVTSVGEEEAVPEGEEEVGEENTDPEVELLPPILLTDSQEDQTFDDDDIRNRGIAICEELKRYFANREIPLLETKQLMRPLIGTLNGILAEIPEA